jgi:general secretion pathway protein K
VLVAVVGITAVLATLLVLLLDSQRSTMRRLDTLFAQTDLRYMALSGLSTSLNLVSRDRNNADGAGDTWYAYRQEREFPLMEGTIRLRLRDATSIFNMNLLAFLDQRAPELRAAARTYLLAKQLPPGIVDATVDWTDENQNVFGATGAEDSYYLGQIPPYRTPGNMMQTPHEITLLRGIRPDDALKVAEYLTVIPKYTTVNINTVDAALLQALVPQGRVSTVVTKRQRTPYLTPAMAEEDLGVPLPKTVEWSAFSPFFEHTGHVMLEARKMTLSALIDREQGQPVLRRLTWR